MRVSAACIRCMVERQEERVHSLEDESKKAEYLKAVLRVIGQSDVETSAPELVEDISKVYEEYFGEEQDFQEIKRIHNQKMLDIESQIWQQIGLTELVPVMENGTGIAGASMRAINEESRKALENADVILAKGQGNFESLYGCGLNVYYLFLCKCDWFVRRFGLTKNAGVFMREGDY